MPSSPRASLLMTALLALGLAISARAQSAATPATEPAKAATEPDASPPAKPKHNRAISGGLAASLADTMPKYAPPPKPVESKPDEEPPDLRETDKPKNTIIRLPKFIVQEAKPPVFREREMLTPESRIALALKRHPGLKFGPLAFLNNGIGLEMLAEEEKLERKKELQDLLSIQQAENSDSAENARLKDEVLKAFLRPGGQP